MNNQYYDQVNSAENAALSAKRASEYELQNFSSFVLDSILVIDDDRNYSKIIARAAAAHGVDTTICNSVQMLSELKRQQYSVIIMDYDLGASAPANGVELAEYLGHSWTASPIVLVSAKNRSNKFRHWSANVRLFVNKDKGPETILQAAFKVAASS